MFPSKGDFLCLGVSCPPGAHGQPEADSGIQGLERTVQEQRRKDSIGEKSLPIAILRIFNLKSINASL